MPYTTLRDGGTAVVGDTTTGLIPQGLHPSAVAYLAVLKANSYSPSRTEIDAINNLVLGLVANGLWTKMQVIFPIMGGTALTHKWNLKDTTTFPITFTGSWTHTSSGMKTATPANIANYAQFGYTPSTHATLGSSHISVYLGTTTATTPVLAIGCNTNDPGGFFQIQTGTTAGVYMQSPILNAVNYGVTFSFSPNLGHIIGSRTSNTSLKAYVGGALKGTNTTTTTNFLPNNLMQLAVGLSNTSRSLPTDQRFQFVTVGTGLTDLEARILTTLVQAYQTTLGRQV